MMWGNNLIDLFKKGGFAIWPLLFLSVVGVAVILERSIVFWWLRSNFQKFIGWLEPIVRGGKATTLPPLLKSTRSPLARVTQAYLDQRDSSGAHRADVVGRESSMQLARFETRQNVLSIIAQLAPMLGLLGTVTGLVSAFRQIEVAGGAVSASDLASGIWEALITTVAGLVVALPCAGGYQLMAGRIDRLALEMEWLTAYLDEWLGLTTDQQVTK